MTYRIGPHSTSDDDSNYRVHDAPVEGFATERDYWEARSPIIRFGKYLEAKGWWSAEEEAELRKSSRKRAIKSLNDAGKLPGNHIKHLFTDVYDEQASLTLTLTLSLSLTLTLALTLVLTLALALTLTLTPSLTLIPTLALPTPTYFPCPHPLGLGQG